MYSEIFIRACKYGHKENILSMIENDVYDWNDGLGNACAGGHKDIVELMIEKGAKNWNIGMACACQEEIKN